MKTKVVDTLSMRSVGSVSRPEDTEMLHVDCIEMANARTRNKETIHPKPICLSVSYAADCGQRQTKTDLFT